MTQRNAVVVEVDDRQVRAMLDHLGKLGTNTKPLLQEIGEGLTETTKQRFDTSRAPDGSRWAANTQTTLERFLGKFRSSFSAKTGKLSKQGAERASGKKPLVGETGALKTTINYQVGAGFVDIGSPMIYARVQQFGAAARSFSGGRAPWGDIPARPFLGISADDSTWLQERLSEALAEAATGPG